MSYKINRKNVIKLQKLNCGKNYSFLTEEIFEIKINIVALRSKIDDKKHICVRNYSLRIQNYKLKKFFAVQIFFFGEFFIWKMIFYGRKLGEKLGNSSKCTFIIFLS